MRRSRRIGLDEADPPEPDPAPATRATAPSPTDLAGWDVYVVDAHSLIFQVFHALPDMTSPRGEHVGAVYGFVRDMLYLVEQKQPAALLCAFDRPGPTFRNDLFAGYKADRSEMPVELVGQIPKIEQAPCRSPCCRTRASRPTTCWPRWPDCVTRRARSAIW
jgi:DNA polymerase-1